MDTKKSVLYKDKALTGIENICEHMQSRLYEVATQFEMGIITDREMLNNMDWISKSAFSEMRLVFENHPVLCSKEKLLTMPARELVCRALWAATNPENIIECPENYLHNAECAVNGRLEDFNKLNDLLESDCWSDVTETEHPPCKVVSLKAGTFDWVTPVAVSGFGLPQYTNVVVASHKDDPEMREVLLVYITLCQRYNSQSTFVVPVRAFRVKVHS